MARDQRLLACGSKFPGSRITGMCGPQAVMPFALSRTDTTVEQATRGQRFAWQFVMGCWMLEGRECWRTGCQVPRVHCDGTSPQKRCWAGPQARSDQQARPRERGADAPPWLAVGEMAWLATWGTWLMDCGLYAAA